MSKVLLVFFLIFTTLTFAQYQNCAKVGAHKVEWNFTTTTVIFKATVTSGQKGWVALSVGTETVANKMNNLTLAMGYKSGTTFNINEYYHNNPSSNVGRPTVYTAQEKQMTSASVADNGSEGLILSFTRPLTSNVKNYYPIVKGTKVRITVAYNVDSVPTSSTSWSKHTKVDGKDVELSSHGVAECSGAFTTSKIVLFTIFGVILTYLF